jgi:alpha-tubulin suppressor-like RCC1 family protein
MRPRLPLIASLLAASALAGSGCNLIFSIEPGEPFGTGGGGAGGGTTTTTTTTTGTGGMGGTGGAPTTTTTTGTGGMGGTGGAPTTTTTTTGTGGMGGTGGGPTCTPSTATCEGAVLHACDAAGQPLAPQTCDAVAGCDALARTCLPLATLPRLGVGQGHACAIEDDRSVRCWGSSDATLVPNDPHSDLVTAVPLAGVSGARQVSVATGQACALRDDGGVICWGSNDSGETAIAPGSPRDPAPVAMPGGLPALEIGTSHRCSCARLAGGSVACWGQQATGCFGTGPKPDEVTITPTLVPGVNDAVQLRVGAFDTPSCVRRASGKVLCWGNKTAPKEIAGVTDATDLTLGRTLVFIRSASKGLLWSTSLDDGFTAAAPYAAAGTLGAMSGGESFCALRSDGVVVCGLLDGPPPTLPTPIPGQPLGTVAEVAVGYALTYGVGYQCLRLAGSPLATRVHCWGDDLAGALGAGSPSNFRTPQQVPGISGTTMLSTAQRSTSVVMGDGAVRYWGLSAALDGVGFKSPTQVGSLGNDNARVSTNDTAYQAYVVKKTGALVLVDFGVPTANQRLKLSAFADFARAERWGHYDLALRTNGTLLVFGDQVDANVSGIYGDGTTTAVLGPPKAIPGLSAVTAIATYGDDYSIEPAHACAIHGAGGAVSCWGEGDHGELGIGPVNAPVPTPTPVAIPNGEAIVSIAVGREFTCAVSAPGSVYCWGSNGSGQLGVDPAFSFVMVPNLVPGISNAVGVTARERHVCAWLADKTAMCWGTNGEGELGDGTIEDRYAPTVVTGLGNVIEMSAGQSHTCARHLDGKISCWGSSYSGQVGTGAVGVFPAPLAVLGL